MADPIRIRAAPEAAAVSTTAGNGPARRTSSLVAAAPSSPPTPPAVTTSPTWAAGRCSVSRARKMISLSAPRHRFRHEHEAEQDEQQPGRAKVPETVGQLPAQRRQRDRRPAARFGVLVAGPHHGQAAQRHQERRCVHQQADMQQAGGGEQPGRARPDDLAALVGGFKP